MSAKYSFRLESARERPGLLRKLILGHEPDEPDWAVLQRVIGYLLFFRERLQLHPNLHNDNIPFFPDLVQLDYELRPVFWAECGDCSARKLNRLAVKVPEAEIWALRPSLDSAETLLREMAKEQLRRDRYRILAFSAEMVEELTSLLEARNQVYWVSGAFEPAQLQFDFNGLWFDAPFQVLRF